ncbi:hypothetical protein [Persicobacter sp. CCB-QB2]|uniref:hypothetical protein n=1 Tax=Persicobacter sp. CCB-QB2 TaxID=1561025 RepID=UPI0006A970BE|nr:hypothetical protein [Persicobacter sp. CCB-QB2]
MKRLFFLLTINLSLWSCIGDDCCVDPLPPGNTRFDLNKIYEPIYAETTEIPTQLAKKRAIESAGQVTIYQHYLMIAESGIGIHIINNENPENPQKIGFLPIAAINGFSIKNDFIYAKHLSDLVVLKINFEQSTVEEVQRLSDQFPHNVYDELPPGLKIVCPDESKGEIIGWKESKATSTKCKR